MLSNNLSISNNIDKKVSMHGLSLILDKEVSISNNIDRDSSRNFSC
jgi:hypothetical protein